MTSPFHYSFKVRDLTSTRKFYGDILGCTEGRSTDSWVDIDFFGHQISAHLGHVEKLDYCGSVDGVSVPIPHFGCLLSDNQFAKIQARLEVENVQFLVKPYQRYEGQAGKQLTMFVLDFSGNPLEFKSFTDNSEIFTC